MTNSIDLPLLIEADQLEPLLGHPKLLILDTCDTEKYRKYHIPGAIHIPPKALQCGSQPVPGKLPSTEQLTELFSNVGLNGDKHVVVYDDEGGGWAGRLIWTLDVIGHKNYSYLNGGLFAWGNERHSLESAPPQIKKTDYAITINKTVIAEVEDIIPQLGNEDFAIWDARSAAEYDGSKVLAQRGGHIPGAVNIDWLELMDRNNNLRLVDLKPLQQRLNECGLDKNKHIVTHCQTHHRSGLTYLAMKILGYKNIQAYHGSWSEWGNREDTPIETGNS